MSEPHPVNSTDIVIDVGNRLTFCGRTFAVSYEDQQPRSRWQNILCCLATYSIPAMNGLCFICCPPVTITLILLFVCLALAATPEYLAEEKPFKEKFSYAAEQIFTVAGIIAAIILVVSLSVLLIAWICRRARDVVLPTVRAI